VPSLPAGRSKAQRWADSGPLSPACGLGRTSAAKTFCAALLSQPAVRARPAARARPATSSRVSSAWSVPVVRLKDCPGDRRLQGISPPSDAEGWIQVETRWSRRRRRLAERPRLPLPRRPVPQDLRGRCFNCLATSHRAAACRRPSCCLRCRRPGHRAADCPGADRGHDVTKVPSGGPVLLPLVARRPVWERLGSQPVAVSVPFSKRRLVWRRVSPPMDHGWQAAAEDGPGQSMIHSRKGRHRTRGRRPRSRSAANLPPVDDDSSVRLPSHQSAVAKSAGLAARPVCVLDRARDLTLVENNLRRCALFAVVIGSRPPVSAELLAAEIAAEYELDPASFSVHRSAPEDFVIILQNEQAALRIFNNGAVLNSPSGSFKFIKWSRLAHAEAVSLPSFVSVSFEGIPLHAWSVETARSLLRAHCTALELHPDTAARLNLSSFRVLGWCRHPELIPVAVDLLIPEPVQSFEVEATVKNLLAYQVTASVSLISPPAGEVSPPPSPPASDDDRDTRSRRRRLQQAPPAGQGGPAEALAVRRPVHERLGPLPICPRHVAISQEVLEQEVSKETSLSGSSNFEELVPAVKELNIEALIEASEDNVDGFGRSHEQDCMVEAGASGLSGGCPVHSPLPVPSSPSSPLRAPADCCSLGGCEKEQAIQGSPLGSPSRATVNMGGQMSALVDARTSSRLSRRGPIITYFRQRRKKDSQPSQLLGASPSPPPPLRVQKSSSIS
jgi:hypothetical protein